MSQSTKTAVQSLISLPSITVFSNNNDVGINFKWENYIQQNLGVNLKVKRNSFRSGGRASV
jgi:hypothetical protein